MGNPNASNSFVVEQLKESVTEYGTELLKPRDSAEELLKKLDDAKDTGGDVSCPGEAVLAIEAGLCNLTEVDEIEILKNDENCNENGRITSRRCDEPPNLRSPKRTQQEQKPDVPIRKKRTRKPYSLMKQEEGYDHFWMFIDWKSLENSHCKKNKGNKIQSRSQFSKKEASKVRTASKSSGEEVVGRKVKVWWPLDQMFYEGKITSFDHLRKKHKVEYDDGDIEILDLSRECWELLGEDNLSNYEQEIAAAPFASRKALNGRGRKSSDLSTRKKASMVRGTTRSFGKELIGCRIEVWWQREKIFCEGKVAAFDRLYNFHQVEYENGYIDFLDLTRYCWRLLGDDRSSTHEQNIVAAAPSASAAMLNDQGRESSDL